MKDVRLSLKAFLPLFLACACTNGEDGYATDVGEVEPPPVETASIDVGPGLESEPGLGVGLNIEVAAGGVWRIATTCDTEKLNLICSWDLVASIDPDAGSLEVSDEATFEDWDQTIRVDPGAVRIYMENGTDADFVELTAPEGAALTLDVMLDGIHYDESILEAISWVSGGDIQTGAPSNPTVFEPTEP